MLMADTISGLNNEALETRKDGTAKEEAIIVAANLGRPDLPPISLQNPTYETRKDFLRFSFSLCIKRGIQAVNAEGIHPAFKREEITPRFKPSAIPPYGFNHIRYFSVST